MNQLPQKTTEYRADIQGLRAVASILVATYHIWFGRVSGGVDVFFVVSAMLITRSLLRQIDTTGRVNFVQFWGGLARRLLPAAMLVLFTVAVASVFWLPRTLWDQTIRQTFTSIFYVQNWQLAFDAVDYLQQGQAASPLQHYWALSTQGQFYLLWPIVLAASVAIATRLGAKRRTIMLCAFAAIFVASFSLSIVETHRNQAFTYFNTFARLWEFCLGAALAVLPSIPPPTIWAVTVEFSRKCAAGGGSYWSTIWLLPGRKILIWLYYLRLLVRLTKRSRWFHLPT